MTISVSDNGIGIPADRQQDVFTAFRRLHRPDEYPGTGVGLAICRKIVDLHDGRIWFESELDRGTTFHVELPCA